MKNLTPEMKAELFPKDLVLLGYRGSVAHNMYVPNSDPNSIDDIDLMGIYMAPADCYLGIKSFKDTREKFVGKYDVVNYEYRKFVSLLLKSNPNVLSLLWLKPNHYLEIHPYGKVLIENRDIFSSKLVFYSFTKYAYSQIKKVSRSAGKYPTDLAYLAGIFDGEGHVSIHKSDPKRGMKSPFFRLDVGITNTDEDLIFSLTDRFGGNVSRTGVRGQHRTDCFRWRLTGPKTIDFLKGLLPFLVVKKRQAEIAISFQNTIMGRRAGTPLTALDVSLRDQHKKSLLAARKDKSVQVPDNPYNKDIMYKSAYMGAKRKALVEKFGYDPKAAAHCIRLLRMGIEFLTSGHLNIYRSDFASLLDIKLGKWTLEEIQSEADRLFNLADEAFVRSSLPNEPNYEKANGIVTDVMYDYVHSTHVMRRI